jgi:hypothetical protein
VTAAPVLDAAKGRLRIAEPTLTVLVAHAADPVGAALEVADAETQLATLRAAGVIQGGRAHPAIASALAAIVRPELCTLELEYSGKAMRGWVSYGGAALLLPAGDDDRRTLIQLHPTLLPEALARLVDLGPRPRPDATAPVAAGEVGDVRRRWRLSAAWTLADGTPGGAALEILDAADGLWLLERGSLAWPVTPTFVWRHIVRLLMRRTGG